jgi:hypothetical protein
MRYVLKLEAIGDGYQSYLRNFDTIVMTTRASYKLTSWRMLKAYKLGGFVKIWVAEITGFHPRFKYERKFCHYEKDYSGASSTGNRGIFHVYFLKPGLYEISRRYSWKTHRRYFAEVIDDETIWERSEEEVIEWLQQKESLESAS